MARLLMISGRVSAVAKTDFERKEKEHPPLPHSDFRDGNHRPDEELLLNLTGVSPLCNKAHNIEASKIETCKTEYTLRLTYFWTGFFNVLDCTTQTMDSKNVKYNIHKNRKDVKYFMTRQYIWQQKMKKAHRCIKCGRQAVNKNYCKKHAEYAKRYQQAKKLLP